MEFNREQVARSVHLALKLKAASVQNRCWIDWYKHVAEKIKSGEWVVVSKTEVKEETNS